MDGDMPLLHVQICGFVVGVQRSSSRILLDVDDGTGFLSCIHWSDLSCSLGDIVTISGKVIEFEGKKEIQAHSIVVETDSMVEMLHWLKTIHLNKSYKISELPSVEFGLDTKPVVVKDPNVELNQFLKELFTQETRIPFHDLVRREDLVELVSKSIKSIEKLKIDSAIALSLRKLLKEGFIYEKEVNAQQLYERVMMENLGNEIKMIVKREAKLLTTEDDGIYVDEIALLLKSSPFADIPKHQIQKLLNQMVSLNILCKVKNKYY
jgi:hypothetical protein